MITTYIKKDHIVQELAEEYAYLEAAASHHKYINNNQEMSTYMLEHVSELTNVILRLGIAKEVYDEAIKIYNFENDGKEEYVNKELCEKVYNELMLKQTEKLKTQTE